MDTVTLATATLPAAAGAWAIWRTLARAEAQRRAARAAWFSAVAPLFAETTLSPQPSGFPRLTGRFAGHRMTLQALPDSLSYRKLPALWLVLSLPLPLDRQRRLALMARPAGTETFSDFAQLPVAIERPAALPAPLQLRCDGPPDPSDLDRLTAIAPFLADPSVKALELSPKGLRLVLLAEEANRSRYLFYRAAELGDTPLSPARLEPALKVLVRLAETHDQKARAA